MSSGHVMTFGEYKARPLRDVPTCRLFWLCSQPKLCALHQNEMRVLIDELRSRLAEPGRVETELLGDVPTAARGLI